MIKIVISFLIGVGYTYFITDKYNDSVFNLWTEAYTVGKDDGYVLGRNDITFEDFTFEQLEAKCMFLYAERDTIFGQGKKGK